MTRAMTCRTVLICAWLAGATVVAMSAQTPALGPQRFEARADIVLVDVAVVDGRGRPVTDLRPDDFVLEVEGQPRALQSVRFLSTPAPPERTQADAPARAREARTSSNTGESSGRLLVIAVDESRLKFGANRAVLRAAESLLERLSPADLVAVARIPGGVGGVEFTTDRDRIRAALRAVTGRPTRSPTTSSVYLSEANEFVNGTREGWPEAIRRQCPDPDDPAYDGCVFRLESAARDLVNDQESRTEVTLRFLDGLFVRLRPLNTPVNLVLISEGMFIGPNVRAEFGRVAARAAAARISLHIVRPDRELYDLQDSGRPADAAQDESLMREGLEQLAAGMRGGLFTATASGAAIFDRISSELSGYYLLGFEPTEDDLNGRDRRIKVEVRRRGVTVRARASFAVRSDGEPAPATTAERLQQALTAPLPTRGIPIRVATYLTAAGGDGQIRVLVGAEVGQPTGEPVTIPVALVVLDASGKAVVSHAGDAELRPALASAPSPGLYLTSVALPPGDYTLRLAAAGPDGQVGAVHHAFSARLRPAVAGLRISDLIVAGTAAAGDGPRPSPSAVVDTDRVTLMLEGQHADAGALAGVRVAFEIASADRDRPLLSVSAESDIRENGTRRAFASLVRLEALPAGEYLARARVVGPGVPEVVFERPFRFERAARSLSTSAAPAASAPASAAAAPAVVRSAPPLPARFMLPMLRFSVEDVLRPEIVNPFLEYLQVNLRPSDAVRSILEEARRGTFAQRPTTGSSADDLVLTFIGGLAALKRGELPQATALFQRTLRGAPDFVGVAFFIGASHAASGRDQEAAGAWQMSLLSREAEPAHRFLVDALLRVGEGQRALDVIQRGPEPWKTRPDAQHREVLAQAVAGDASALSGVQKLIAERPSDPDLLLVGIQVLYRKHLSERLAGPELSLFDEWTRRYQDTAGPRRPSVAPWRSYVLR
jgi:VWFA-related protein